MKSRIILHMDMDYFFAQIEERENPQFKGKPVVVGADPKGGRGRGVVSTCNYEARKYGIHSALPISKAFQLCPQAIFLPVNIELYQKVSENIMEIIKKYSPIWEVVSLDEAYLDISFLKNYKGAKLLAEKLKKEIFYKGAKLLAEKLKREIFEKEKLTSTIGLGPNKLIAKMAAEKGKPNGLLVKKPKQVRKFLEPLDIEDLPGIGPKTAEKLSRRIARLHPSGFGNGNAPRRIKIKDLKKLSKKELVELLGMVGETIYERARGINETLVTSEEIIKSIGKEHTFEKDTRDPEIIFGTFEKIIKNVQRELVENNFSFKTITVVCRFQGFETHTKSKTLEKPTQDLEILKKEAKRLLLKFLLENKKPLRLIGLRLKIC